MKYPTLLQSCTTKHFQLKNFKLENANSNHKPNAIFHINLQKPRSKMNIKFEKRHYLWKMEGANVKEREVLSTKNVCFFFFCCCCRSKNKKMTKLSRFQVLYFDEIEVLRFTVWRETDGGFASVEKQQQPDGEKAAQCSATASEKSTFNKTKKSVLIKVGLCLVRVS